MNFKTIFAALLAIVGPILARRGIVLPPEFASSVGAIGVFVCGLVANGVKLGFNDWPTTVSGLVGGAATALAAFGFDLPLDVQMGISTIALALIGGFAKWPKWLINTGSGSNDLSGAGNS